MSVKLLHPKYWLMWLLVMILRAMALLPWRWQLGLGRGLGILGYHLVRRRRRIVDVNLKLCFPELSEPERRALAIASFKAVGMGVFETLIAWWKPKAVFAEIPFQYFGLEHIQAAQARGDGVIICGAHFTCMELIGRNFAERFPLSLVYRRHDHPVYEHVMIKCRARYIKKNIDRYEIKTMIKTLRNGGLLWYAPDQDLGRNRSIFAPFFNIATATVPAMSGLARMGKAAVIPVCFFRTADNQGYECHFLPPFQYFPSGDEVVDATRYNAHVEQYVREHPEQYLWQHRRFKTRPQGEPKLY